MVDRAVLKIPNVVGARQGGESHQTSISSGSYTTALRGFDAPLMKVRLRRKLGGEDVTIETNFPKLVLGHNVRGLGISELRQAATDLRRRVEALLEVPLPAAESWEAHTLEYHHDWVVDDPSAYVLLAHRLARQRTGNKHHLMGTAGRSGYTFAFGTKSSGGRVYDKEAEVRTTIARARGRTGSHLPVEEMMRLSKGRLRFEVVAKGDEIGTWLEKPATLGAVLDDLGEDPFGYVAIRWRALIPEWRSDAYLSALTRLKKAYPPSKALNLINAWVHMQQVGLVEYQKACDVHRGTVPRTLKAMLAAGVTPDADNLLEPLEVCRLYADW